MLRLILSAALPLLLAAATPPKLRLSEVQQIAPENYRVELTLDPKNVQFSGSILIRVKITQPAQTIWLNANQLTIQDASLTAAGRTLPAAFGCRPSVTVDLAGPRPQAAACSTSTIANRSVISVDNSSR